MANSKAGRRHPTGGTLPSLQMVVRRCLHCGRESAFRATGYVQNSYCRDCLMERIASADKAAGPSKVEHVGDYFMVTRPTQTTS